MKKLINLTIPVLIAVVWSVLLVTTLQDIGELAAAVAGPSPDLFGPAIQITAEPLAPEVKKAALRVQTDGKVG